MRVAYGESLAVAPRKKFAKRGKRGLSMSESMFEDRRVVMSAILGNGSREGKGGS